MPTHPVPLQARVVSVLMALLALAGCVEPSPESKPPSVVSIETDRPAPTFADVTTGPAVGPDLNATTAAAPRLVEGEWWRIRFDSGFYDGITEVVRVVANATADGYLFGMPHEGWFKEAIAYHAPAFGDVALNLSYAVHNTRFEPVRFPLVQGATWQTVFATAPFTATVESADAYSATIRLDPPPNPDPMAPVTDLMGLTGGGSMWLTYDARQHEVVEMRSFIGSWKVVEHGYNYRGWVTVPRGEHTAIDYGTFWAASQEAPLTTRTIEVAGGFNRLTMMHLIAPLTPGAYHIRSTTPQGDEFLTETTGTEDPQGGFILRFYEASDPDGVWTQEDLAAGAAATYSMGIAYHQYDIHLPDGGRRSDHSHAVIR